MGASDGTIETDGVLLGYRDGDCEVVGALEGERDGRVDNVGKAVGTNEGSPGVAEGCEESVGTELERIKKSEDNVRDCDNNCPTKEYHLPRLIAWYRRNVGLGAEIHHVDILDAAPAIKVIFLCNVNQVIVVDTKRHGLPSAWIMPTN